MATRRELPLEEKINLIKEKEQGVSHRELCNKFHISIGAVSNILKRKCEYTHDYETNKNKRIKRYAKILGLNIDRLKKCKGDSSTITCRNITRELFPNVAERARTTVAQMEDTIIKAITGAYKM